MIEASDMNDGDILRDTVQKNDGKGNIMFEYLLPSGRKLTSEWVNPDNRRKAIMAWLDAVKSQAALDSQVEEERRNAMLREAQAKRRRDTVDPAVAAFLFGIGKSGETGVGAGSLLEGPVPAPLAKAAPEPAPAPAPSAPQPKLSEDPTQFVRDQLASTGAEVVQAGAAVEQAQRWLAEATQRMEQWKRVATTLGVS